jgi:hypothetical protein
MADQKERNHYEQQIYNQMRLKETEELPEVWLENNREKWTDEAFEAVRAILQERLVKCLNKDL